MFYSIPTCTDESAAFKKPYIDPARPTLLLIHGGACDSRSFQQQIQDPVLNQNFNLVRHRHVLIQHCDVS
jgi:pimeloyl-ACP methyl ester carboxylesterase